MWLIRGKRGNTLYQPKPIFRLEDIEGSIFSIYNTNLGTEYRIYVNLQSETPCSMKTICMITKGCEMIRVFIILYVNL